MKIKMDQRIEPSAQVTVQLDNKIDGSRWSHYRGNIVGGQTLESLLRSLLYSEVLIQSDSQVLLQAPLIDTVVAFVRTQYALPEKPARRKRKVKR